MTFTILEKDLLELLKWAGYTVGGYALGLLLQRIFFPLLTRLVNITPIHIDDAVVKGVNRISVFLTVLFGFTVGFYQSHLFPKYRVHIQDGIIVALILLITWGIIAIVDEVALWQMNQAGKSLPRSSIMLNIINVIIFVIGILFILQYLGISIWPALTALGVGGLAVALALQDTLSNLFAGIQLLTSKSVKVGDYIQISPTEEGFLDDIGWRNSTIRTSTNNIIIIPNSKLSGSNVKNFDFPNHELAIPVAVGVAYDSDLQHVEKVAIEVGTHIQQTVEGAVRSHIPVVRFHTFADSSINFNVILRGEGFTSQFLIRHEFIKALHERFAQEGIQIPFPIRTVYTKTSSS